MIGRTTNIERMKNAAKRLCGITEWSSIGYRIIENDNTNEEMKGDYKWILS